MNRFYNNDQFSKQAQVCQKYFYQLYGGSIKVSVSIDKSTLVIHDFIHSKPKYEECIANVMILVGQFLHILSLIHCY